MKALFASGALIDAIIAGMAAEAFLLAGFHRLTGLGVAPATFLPNLLAGLALLIAMRVLIGGGWWGWVSLSLLAALGFHVIDLRRLWRR